MSVAYSAPTAGTVTSAPPPWNGSRSPQEQFEARHQDAIGWWEEGRMTMSDYLDATVFYQDRPFTQDAFSALLCSRRANPTLK